MTVMRKNGYSTALRDFEGSLWRAKHLHSLEKRLYKDPPPPVHRTGVESLRAGAAVLMVASLERYLKDAFEEFIMLIAATALVTTHAKLPITLVDYNDLNYVSWLVRESRMEKADRLAEIRRTARQIASSNFLPESFNRTRANPGSQVVKDLCNQFGISDPFAVIESNFSTHYKKPFARGFVQATLDNIVARRNEVAHGGFALAVARSDLDESLKFLFSFGRAADNTLRDRALTILASL
jgi:hypothetical protein